MTAKIKTMTPRQIKALRRHLGLTQEQLGQRTGVGRTAVTLWESGLRHPSRPATILLGMLKEDVGQKN